MREQLEHLVELGRHRNFEVIVIPFGTAARAALHGGFSLFDFSGERDRTVVCDEGPVAAAVATEEIGYVNLARGHIRRLLQAGLDAKRSLKVIEEHIARWEEHE